MNPDNRWVIKSEMIPWDEIEDRYAKLFPSTVPLKDRKSGEAPAHGARVAHDPKAVRIL